VRDDLFGEASESCGHFGEAQAAFDLRRSPPRRGVREAVWRPTRFRNLDRRTLGTARILFDNTAEGNETRANFCADHKRWKGLPKGMKAKVFVTLKEGVLDPQGKAIQHSVELLGWRGVADVRQGKYFEIVLDQSLGVEEARALVERLASEVLSNPVIEDYRVEIEAV